MKIKLCCFWTHLCTLFRLNWVQPPSTRDNEKHVSEGVQTRDSVRRSTALYLWTTEPVQLISSGGLEGGGGAVSYSQFTAYVIFVHQFSPFYPLNKGHYRRYPKYIGGDLLLEGHFNVKRQNGSQKLSKNVILPSYLVSFHQRDCILCPSMFSAFQDSHTERNKIIMLVRGGGGL